MMSLTIWLPVLTGVENCHFPAVRRSVSLQIQCGDS